jgi:Na+-driven multidrug efflux pump
MLSIGLPAGSEFLLITLSMAVVYLAVRQFGSPAQAAVGIGSRIQQASLMPAVAIGFAVAAVAGQNFGAAAFQRVRESFRESAKLTTTLSGMLTIAALWSCSALMRAFTDDPQVIEIGADFIWMLALNYTAQGLVFVVAGIFQGLGNTWPSLLASAVRCFLFAAPVLWLSRQHGFAIQTIWYWSIAATTVQLAVSLFLLRRELDAKTPGLMAAAAPQGESNLG